MNNGATDDLIDELIPPPGPRGRRIVLWVVFLALVVSVAVSWQAGAIVPRLDQTRWLHWGGEGPVYVGVLVRNGSPLPIEVTRGPHDRAGLDPMGYALGTYEYDRQTGIWQLEPGIDLSELPVDALAPDPFPVRLEPGEGVVLTAVYQVTDCAAVRAGDPTDRAVDIEVRMAGGPFSHLSHKRLIPNAMTASGWPAEISQYACGFAEPID